MQFCILEFLILFLAQWLNDVTVTATATTPAVVSRCSSSDVIASKSNFIKENIVNSYVYSVWPDNIKQYRHIQLCKSGPGKLTLAEMKIFDIGNNNNIIPIIY